MIKGGCMGNCTEQIRKYPIAQTIQSFYGQLRKDPNHRYRSWEHCFLAFQRVILSTASPTESEVDYLSLHLAFYLASWGMYRGSSGLLWKDYKIYHPVVESLIKNLSKTKFFRENQSASVLKDERKLDQYLDVVFDIKKAIANYLNEIRYIKSLDNENETLNDSRFQIAATDTLLTKILLGTIGCAPAYDRLFKKGANSCNLKCSNFSKRSFRRVLGFTRDNLAEFQSIKAKIDKYPLMKLVDMYFWNVGVQLEINESK